MYAATSILAIIAVAATCFGLALEYASTALYSDKTGSMAVSIVGAGVVALGIASEYGLHLESSDITSRMREVHCEIEASQQRISELPKQAASDEGQAASAGERTRRPVAKSCKGQ